MSKGKKIVLISVAVLAVTAYIFCLPRQLFNNGCSAVLYSSDGTLLGAHISSDGQWHFPPANSVPQKFQKCIITFEDKRFRRHIGVDFASVGRALVSNVRSRRVVSGASTITMQVIRLSRSGKPRNFGEKMLEAVLATRLELRCSKDEILALYAANAPFGGNVVGLEAASWRYFGHGASDLSWAESATLAVLPNSPALIHPGRGRDKLLSKRNRLLDKLHACSLIDAEDLELAKEEPLPDKPHPMPDLAYHLLERSRRENGAALLQSTIDYALQCRVNAVAAQFFELYHQNMVDNMGVLVASVRTGEILAYYGNTRGCARSLRGVDVDMVPARRSSGSTLKPILYAAMLQNGMLLPGTLVKDTPYSYNDFEPHNFSRSFDGAVPAHEVIERSLNVPSVRMLEKYGAPEFLELLHGMGFDTIDRDADHYGLSLILGGAEISLQNLVRAYYYMAAKLNGYDIRRNLTYVASAPFKALAADDVPVSNAAAWLTFDALSQAGRPEEEGAWSGFSSSRKVAWKTGTSWGGRDAWSVGTDGGYVVGVWVGNSDGEGRPGMTGVSYAAPVMFNVFSSLPRSEWFDLPVREMEQVEVCHSSGLPPSDICPVVDTVWAPAGVPRPERCRYHRLVHIDPAGEYQVNADCCPANLIRNEVWFVLPPAMEWYYMRSHVDYHPLPPLHPSLDVSTMSGRSAIDIIYPQHGMTIVCTRGLDSVSRGAVFRAAHTDPSAVLFWHLDSEYLGSTVGEHTLMVHPSEGTHILTVMDSAGACRRVRFVARN